VRVRVCVRASKRACLSDDTYFRPPRSESPLGLARLFISLLLRHFRATDRSYRSAGVTEAATFFVLCLFFFRFLRRHTQCLSPTTDSQSERDHVKNVPGSMLKRNVCTCVCVCVCVCLLSQGVIYRQVSALLLRSLSTSKQKGVPAPPVCLQAAGGPVICPSARGELRPANGHRAGVTREIAQDGAMTVSPMLTCFSVISFQVTFERCIPIIIIIRISLLLVIYACKLMG